MIYQPGEVFNVRNALNLSFIGALLAAAEDFISGDNKPWTYYLGVGFGNAALATGIPGAAATLYIIGDTFDAVFFKSPDGSDVRIFLNGIAHTSLDTYAASSIWETINIAGLVGGVVNRVDIVNYGPSPNPSATGIPWLGLGPVTVYGSDSVLGAKLMPDVLSVRLVDSEADTTQATIPIYLPTGSTLAEIQAYADAILPEIDDLTGAEIVAAEVTFTLTLPGGLKADPVAASLNERGGLITFDTSGPRRDSVRIPAMLTSLMPGDSFSILDPIVAAFITRLTTATTAATIRPQTANGFNWVEARSGKKSFRK